MSQQALAKFRDLVRASLEIQEQIRSAAANGSLDLVALGKIHGCEFTVDEAQAFLQQEAELSDFELEMLSGGWGGKANPHVPSRDFTIGATLTQVTP